MAATKRRLDQLLAERGLAPTREKAQAFILAGEVTVNGQKASKASQMVGEDAVVELAAKPPYVSRGGLKRSEEHTSELSHLKLSRMPSSA